MTGSDRVVTSRARVHGISCHARKDWLSLIDLLIIVRACTASLVVLIPYATKNREAKYCLSFCKKKSERGNT
jgi:hypothetical protein